MLINKNKTKSQTFSKALLDLVNGLKLYQLWLQLGWQDVKQRYRRSVIGPFWITIATAVMAFSLGILYAFLFDIELKYFLPYVTVGLIFWSFIQNCLLDGAEVFILNEGLIKQLPAPISVHVYRLIWRQLLFLTHNIIIYVILIIFYPQPINFSIFLIIPALLLIILNTTWVVLFFGIIASRYRDVVPLVTAITQLLFYLTPIVWTAEKISSRGKLAQDKLKIIELNPLYHFLSIIRAPLLGKEVMLHSWLIVVVITLIGWLITLIIMRNFRYRVAYWV